MGTVWLARQTEPVTRQVALKIIKLGMDTREVVARFEGERQALALMEHPCIARVLDGGATDAGRPYFAMDLVAGDSITEFANRAELGIRERLELFARVCDAIQHAHLKGVVHRDIKPSNVLVSEQGDEIMPKVIDFGIAKATGVEHSAETIFTEHGQIIGTPQYMAPEQAGPLSHDIDTRADVYSLGVLLYELLTGTTPFELRPLLEIGFDELLRTIREVDPERPSTRASSTNAEKVRLGAAERARPELLSRALRGDLDWIVMKALEKDRDRRYETASGLAADVRRFLAGEPVLAHPQGAAYRLRKFVARRKRFVALAAAFLVVLVGGTIGTTVGWVRTREANRKLEVAGEAKDLALIQKDEAIAQKNTALEERDQALVEKEQERAAAVEARDNALELARFQHLVIPRQLNPRNLGGVIRYEFVQELERVKRRSGASDADVDAMRAAFDELTAGLALPDLARNVVSRGLLDKASIEIEPMDEEKPAIAAELRHSLALGYRNIGLYEEQAAQLRRALELSAGGTPFEERRQLYQTDLALALSRLGRFDESIAITRAAYEEARDRHGIGHPTTAHAAAGLCGALLKFGRSADAIEIGLPALAGWRERSGPKDLAPGTLYTGTIRALAVVGRLEEADELLAEALELHAEGRLDLRDGYLHENAAFVREQEGRLDEAAELYARAVEEHRKSFGAVTVDVIVCMNNLAVVLNALGRHAEAADVLGQAIDGALEVLGPEHANTGVFVHTLGETCLAAREWSDAEEHLRRALEIYRAAGFDTHMGLLLTQLAQVAAAQGRRDEAFEWLAEGRPFGLDASLAKDAAFDELRGDPRFEEFFGE